MSNLIITLIQIYTNLIIVLFCDQIYFIFHLFCFVLFIYLYCFVVDNNDCIQVTDTRAYSPEKHGHGET